MTWFYTAEYHVTCWWMRCFSSRLLRKFLKQDLIHHAWSIRLCIFISWGWGWQLIGIFCVHLATAMKVELNWLNYFCCCCFCCSSSKISLVPHMGTNSEIDISVFNWTQQFCVCGVVKSWFAQRLMGSEALTRRNINYVWKLSQMWAFFCQTQSQSEYALLMRRCNDRKVFGVSSLNILVWFVFDLIIVSEHNKRR